MRMWCEYECFYFRDAKSADIFRAEAVVRDDSRVGR